MQNGSVSVCAFAALLSCALASVLATQRAVRMLFTHVPFHTVAAMQDYRQQCYWDTIAAPPDGTVLNMLRAGDSDRWDAPMIARLNEALDAAKMCTAQVNPCSFGLYARGAASSTKM